MRSNILIVGGYGVVGRRVAAQLAPRFPERVLIAGRDEQRALALAGSSGTELERPIDVEDATSVGLALDGVGTVTTCVAQRELHLLRTSIARGVAYTDIASTGVLAGRRGDGRPGSADPRTHRARCRSSCKRQIPASTEICRSISPIQPPARANRPTL